MGTTGIVCCSIFIIVCIVVVCINIANTAKGIAVMKGHAGSKYFWYTLFIPPVGLSMVIALPDLYARPNAVASTVHNETLPEL